MQKRTASGRETRGSVHSGGCCRGIYAAFFFFCSFTFAHRAFCAAAILARAAALRRRGPRRTPVEMGVTDACEVAVICPFFRAHRARCAAAMRCLASALMCRGPRFPVATSSWTPRALLPARRRRASSRRLICSSNCWRISLIGMDRFYQLVQLFDCLKKKLREAANRDWQLPVQYCPSAREEGNQRVIVLADSEESLLMNP